MQVGNIAKPAAERRQAQRVRNRTLAASIAAAVTAPSEIRREIDAALNVPPAPPLDVRGMSRDEARAAWQSSQRRLRQASREASAIAAARR